MKKYWQRTMAIFLVAILVLGALTPGTARAIESGTEVSEIQETEAPAKPEEKAPIPGEAMSADVHKALTASENEETTIPELGEEKVGEPVRAGDPTNVGDLIIIAKAQDGNYYGIPTYNNEYKDITGNKVFFKMTEEQYRAASADFVLHLKRQDGTAFEVPKAKIDGQTQEAGKIFTELECRHHPAFRYLVLNHDPFRADGMEGVVWSITLKKDCELGTVPGFGGGDKDPDPFFIHYSCEIDGGGHRVYRTGDKEREPLFHVSNNAKDPTHPITATFRNITINGEDDQNPGTPQYQGFMVNPGHNPEITFAGGVVITHCKADTGQSGSAMHLSNANLTMTGAGNRVEHCVSEDSVSGAIYAGDKVTIDIDGAHFIGNRGANGGAICSLDEHSVVTIKHATFQDNEVIGKNNNVGYGGAIYANGPITILGNTTFTGNTATSRGGAICSWSTLTINGTTFTGNKATWGGALFSRGNTIITDTTFEKNEGKTFGGAIYHAKGKLEAKNTAFTQNKMTLAPHAGAAVYFAGGLTDVQKVEACTFSENEASIGAGIYLDTNTKLDVVKSTFAKNHAQRGAAIATPAEAAVDTAKAKLNIDADSSFTENKAFMGGAIFTAIPTKITKSVFTGNEALFAQGDNAQNPHKSGVGGAIYVMNRKTEIQGTKFEKNTAFGSGGAVAISGVTRDNQGNITGTKPDIMVEIGSNTSFLSNRVQVGQGGAVYVIPYAYENPVTHKTPLTGDDPYQKVKIDATTIFRENVADTGYAIPPKNYADFTNLLFKENSFTGKTGVHESLTKSILNNYDVNYRNPNLQVIYDANRGIFADGTDEKVENHTLDFTNPQGIRITVTNETPSRSGYTFLGWQGEDNKLHQAGEELTIGGSTTFIAKWKKDNSTPSTPGDGKETATLIYDAKGGAWTNGDTIRRYTRTVGEIVTIEAAPVREGYKFLYWKGSEYHPGDSYTVPEGGHTFVAEWEAEKKPEEKPSVTPNIKTPKGTPLTPDEIAKILQGMKKSIPAIPRAGVSR